MSNSEGVEDETKKKVVRMEVFSAYVERRRSASITQTVSNVWQTAHCRTF